MHISSLSISVRLLRSTHVSPETLERHARPTHSSPMCASGQRSLLGETAAASASQG